MSLAAKLTRHKSVEALQAELGSRRDFRRVLGLWQLTAIGLGGLTPHELRHTAASLAVSAGAHVKAVQRILGHASASVTLDVYADLFDEDLDTVGTSLDRVAMQTNVADLLPHEHPDLWEHMPPPPETHLHTDGIGR